MSDEELLKSVHAKIKRVLNLTDEKLEDFAFEYIKKERKNLPNRFFWHNNNKEKICIFMAGGSGAGKTEAAENLSEKHSIDIIDTDKIRQICPGYTGANSHLFQKASSCGVSVLLNHSFKNNLSFILDGNFAEYKIQEQNIERAINRNYDITIAFVYRNYNVSKEYTKIREKKEGRKVPNEVFNKKYIGSIITTLQILKKYQDIDIIFIDLMTNKIQRDKEIIKNKLLVLSKNLEKEKGTNMLGEKKLEQKKNFGR